MNRRASVGRAFVVLVGLMLGAWCVARYEPNSYLHTDGEAYAKINRAIAEHGNLDLAPYDRTGAAARQLTHGLSTVALGPDGRWLPKHSFLTPLVATPFFVAFGLPGLLCFNVLASIAMLVLVCRFAARFTGEVPAALATLALATSPVVMEQVYGYSHDVGCTVLVAAALVALSERRMACAGLATGFALWAKPTLAGVLGPMTLAVVWACSSTARPSARPSPDEGGGRVPPARSIAGVSLHEWWRYVLAFAAPTVAHAAANTYLYGAPWTTSYARVMVVRHGATTIEPISNYFGRPLATTLVDLVTRPTGLVEQMPLALAGLAGLLLLLRRHRALALGALGSVLGFLAIFGTYAWPLARYAIPWLPVFAVGLGSILATIARTWPTNPPTNAPNIVRENRAIMIGVGVAAALAIMSLLILLVRQPPPRLSGRLWSAAASVGGMPCDSFDLLVEQLSCLRWSSDQFYPAGRPRPTQCTASRELGPLMFVAPEMRRAVTTVVWRDLPRGREPRLLLATDRRAPGTAPSVVGIRANGRSVRSFQIEGSNTARDEALPSDLLSRESNTLELDVRGAPTHVCLDIRWN